MENGNTIKKTVFQRFSDDSVMLAELDKSKVFGLHLQAAEAKDLETFAKVADFLLDNQDAQEEKLNNLIIGTLVYVMGKGFSSKIATDCLGCKEGNANQTMHDCRSILTDPEAMQQAVQLLVKEKEVKKEFDEKLVFLLENLFISKARSEILVFVKALEEEHVPQLAEELTVYNLIKSGKGKIVKEFWDDLKKFS